MSFQDDIHLRCLLGKLYKSNCWFKKTPNIHINYHQKKKWEDTNPHFKKGTTQVHTTKLYRVMLSKFSLLQRSRQHTRSWRLLFHTIRSTHSAHFIHSPMQKRSVHTQWCLTFLGSHSIIGNLTFQLER